MPGSNVPIILFAVSILVSSTILSSAVAAVVDGCTTIDSPGYYYLSTDIINTSATTCINITSSDVVLDGKGRTIDGIANASIDNLTYTGILVYKTENVTIRNVTLTDWHFGVHYFKVRNGRIEGVNASRNCVAAFLNYSESMVVANSRFVGNTIGITMVKSNNSEVTGNNISDNLLGIGLNDSNNNSLNDNILMQNLMGIFLGKSNYNEVGNSNVSDGFVGVIVERGRSNTIAGNVILNNAIGFSMSNSTANVIESNMISGNVIGLDAEKSDGNVIYNNYFNNTVNANVSECSNIWNVTKTAGTNVIGGSYIGGNYWAKPDGSGYSQTCSDANRDGICDSPYEVDDGNVDFLPLTVVHLHPPTANFYYYPANPRTGEKVTFNASLSKDSDGWIVSYQWDFGDGGKGTGKVVQHIYTAPGKYNVTLKVIDNDGLEGQLTYGIVVSEMVKGDFDGNGKVDFNDLIATLNLILNNGYNPAVDMDGNGEINFNDLIAVLNEILSSG